MVNKCAAYGCKNGYNGPQEGITFHRFPLNNNALLNEWLKNIGRKDFNATKHSRLCSVHFSACSFRYESSDSNPYRKRETTLLCSKHLKSDAVPTIFPNCPAFLQQPDHKSRGSNATREMRQTQESQRLQASIEMFWKDEIVTNLNDISKRLESECALPSGFIWTQKENKVIIMLLEENPPSIVASITVHDDMKFTVHFKGFEMEANKFNHIISASPSGFILKTFCELKNLMAELKSLIASDVPENSLQNAKSCLEEFLLNYKCEDRDLCKKVNFILEQIDLMLQNECARRYSTDLIISAYLLYAMSTNAYRELRQQQFLILPSERTLRNVSKDFGKQSQDDYLRLRLSKLNSYEKNVVLIIDEIYTAQRAEYSSSEGKVLGLTADHNVSSTILAFMISSIANKYRDVVALCPIENLTVKKIEDNCYKVLSYLDRLGFNVLVICTDNHPVNRSFFINSLCKGNLSSRVENPINGRPLFLLFDPVHNIKNVYNNFQAKKTMSFPEFHSDCTTPVHNAKFSDIQELYDIESEKPVKIAHRLTAKSLNPKAIEKSSVKLAMSIFNESTKHGLEFFVESNDKNWKDTAVFVALFIKLWNVVNVKTVDAGLHKRDVTKDPVKSVNDWKLTFLLEFADFLKRWQSSKTSGLTKETFLAMHHMCQTLPMIAKHLIETLGFRYVLLGKLQSDALESRFGWYRQLSGGNYFISAKQVVENEKKIKALSLMKFSGISFDEIRSDRTNLEWQDDALIDVCWSIVSANETVIIDYADINVVCYIAGALVCSELRQKGCMSCKGLLCDGNLNALSDEQFDSVNHEARHFISVINRGGLKMPTDLAFSICIKCFGLFSLICKNESLRHNFLSAKNQRNLFLSLLFKFHNGDERTCEKGHDFHKALSVRFFNCCMKNFVKSVSVQSHHVVKKRKIDKLTSNY